jgi:hypothetical protein
MTKYAKRKLKYSRKEHFNLLHYVEWDRFVTLAGSKSELRVMLSYLGKILPILLNLNDQYLNITGKYQYDVLLSLSKQNSVFLQSIRLSCRKSKC